MSFVRRTPRSTDGSYSEASWGVRFILSSCATRDWSTPCAAARPASVRSRFRSEPRTLTKTRAWRRSGDVRTPVTVTKPMRGSFSSPMPSESTSFTASSTRRRRSLIERHELAGARPELPFLAVQVPLRLVEQPLGLPRLARDAGDGEARALPQLVVVDLRDRRAEAVLELRLRRAHELPLALQRASLREMEVDREDADVAHAHPDHSAATEARSGYLGAAEAPLAVPSSGRAGFARASVCNDRSTRRILRVRRSLRVFGEVGALDLRGLEDLEDVALAQVVEPFEEDAALEAFGHLAHVVLEAAELRDRRLVDDRADADDLPHLHLAERLLGLDRAEHADERLLDVLRELVDDAVGADVDALALRERARLGARPHVEADDERVRDRREVDVVLGDAADPGVDDVHAHLGVLDLLELGDRRLDGSVHAALDDEVQVLDAAGLHLREELLEPRADLRLLRELLAAQPLAAHVGQVARLPLVLDDAAELAGR